MKNLMITLLAVISLHSAFAQEISQNIFVEHYTNSRCGICAQRNPALFTLLENYNEIKLTYFPSSPYSNCIFSMHNATEADGRTNYYSVYGSTPRVVLNGEVVPAASVILQESRIDTEVSNTTPFKIEVSQEYLDADSVKVIIKVSTVAMTTLTSLKLHAMIAEHLVIYDAPNGEDEHPNVFRKALYGLNGESFTVPANGTELTFEKTYSFDPDWVKEDLEIIAFIQDDSDKTIKQAQVSARLGTFGNTPNPTSINTIANTSVKIFPNPTSENLNIIGLEENANISIYNILGEKVISKTINNQTVNTSQLIQGVYFLELFLEGKRYIHKINKK